MSRSWEKLPDESEMEQPKPVAELPDLVAQATNSRPSVRVDQSSSRGMECASVGTGGRRKRRPLTVRAEFVVVSGREGEVLEAYQDAVILDILRWIHDHQEPSDQ